MILEKAKQFAKLKHAGQKDDKGLDYFEAHIQPVVEILKIITKDEATLAAAYLHDTIEDTTTNSEEIEKEFGSVVKDLVMEVTQEGKKDKYGYYFPRLHSKEAIMIKFADRLSNLSRIDNWPEERREQYLRKSKFWRSFKGE